ncbi:MAG TPA: LCP family protein [Chloroflexota bacterium]
MLLCAAIEGPFPRRVPTSFAGLLLALLALLLLAVGGVLLYLGYVQPLASVVRESTGQVVARPEDSQPLRGQPASDELAAAAPATGVPPSTARRLNILLLGSDTDAKFVGVYDTQIMIVVSLDQQRNTVSMLSIPRDLWVPIPGWGMGKVGTAYHDGGLALARQTIEQNFQIPIDYYAWVGLDGFVKVIDTLGGVDLDVAHPIVDDRYPDDLDTADPYAYRRLYIPAGPQHLDGTRALEYVRSRHGDLIGDFGRSARQQQLLQAVREKTSGEAIAANLPRLALDLRDSIRTDLTVVDLARLAVQGDQMRQQPVQRYVLTPPAYSRDGWSNDGQQILIPEWPAVRQLVAGMLG